MVEGGIVLDVFPKIKKDSMMRMGLVRLNNGDTIEFSGLFYSNEEKKLKKGSAIEGYLMGNALRNAKVRP